MNKISVFSFLVVFTLLISFISVSAEEPLKHPKSSLSENFSISPTNEQFSLKKNYPVRISDRDGHVLGTEILKNETSLQQIPVNPRIEELEHMIKRTKTKRVWLKINTGVFAAIGGYFVYEFFTFEEQVELERDPQSIQTKQSKFSRKRNFVFGALLTFGVSAAFLNSSIQAKKRIKSYEKELKELREAQAKISSRHL